MTTTAEKIERLLLGMGPTTEADLVAAMLADYSVTPKDTKVTLGDMVFRKEVVFVNGLYRVVMTK